MSKRRNILCTHLSVFFTFFFQFPEKKRDEELKGFTSLLEKDYEASMVANEV